MEPLRIEQTESSFGIDFDHNTHTLTFKGESRPENSPVFFQPLMDWLNDYKNYLIYLKDQSEINVNVDFRVDYFNSTSAKFILDIIMMLKEISDLDNVNLVVNWHYRSMDEDMLESGEEFQDMTEMDIRLLPY
jgi:hypothetical protein